jgi:Fe-S oxidoreductase/nitrate reductase gamma subunit
MQDSGLSTLTRQIYWAPQGEIGTWLRASTYAWLILGLAIAGYGIYRHWRSWRIGKPEDCFDDPVRRIGLVLSGVVAQARVLRRRRQRDATHSQYAAWMHGLIFYGFSALVFGTTIVALQDYGIVSLYQGWFYGLVTVVCEAGGLALGIGLLMGMLRRTKRPAEFRHALDYSILYLLLFVLTVQGFAIEALRLAVQENPVDGPLSFVGYAGSQLIVLLFGKPTPEAAQWTYAALWSFHMLTTMGFIAAVPYTRAMHIVTSVLNLYTERPGPKVLLPQLDLSNENAEYFGPKTIRDFSWKDLLSFDSCTECRRCTDICPANAVGKTLDPRSVILKLRDSMRAEVQLGVANTQESADLYGTGVITNDEIWACTNCGGCVSECPVGIDQLGTIMQLRRYQTLSLGEVPQAAAKAIENVLQHGNPWGVSGNDRMNWAKDLDIPVLTEDSPEVEWLYWVGCAGAYDPANQNVTKAVIKILKSAGVPFAVMGKAESCSGEPVKRLGDEYNFSEIARSNVTNLKALKFKKVVTHCPHCFNTLKNDYKEYGGDFEVYHHTQLIEQLSSNGALKQSGSNTNQEKESVTYHDPCFLGRHNDEYDAPRKLIEDVAGLNLVEMTLSRQTSSCCGMGGGNMWYESAGGASQIVDDRLGHVAATGTKKLVTGCSFCLINFRSALGRVEGTEGLEVVDVAQVVADRL